MITLLFILIVALMVAMIVLAVKAKQTLKSLRAFDFDFNYRFANLVKDYERIDNEIAALRLRVDNLSDDYQTLKEQIPDKDEVKLVRKYSEQERLKIINDFLAMKLDNPCLTITAFAKVVGVPRRTLSNWLKVTDGQNTDKG